MNTSPATASVTAPAGWRGGEKCRHPETRIVDAPTGVARMEGSMHVSDILRDKGTNVVTTDADETVAATARLLNLKRIGAVVVCDAPGKVIGVISERDIIRSIAVDGKRALDMRVRDLMTSDVISCKPTDTIAEVMKVMTLNRFRHLPVMEGDALKGIVSIGDVVKIRLEETEMEARSLRDYVLAGH
jgi:CBS domain-containing protein